MDAPRKQSELRKLPSVDEVLGASAARVAIDRFGRTAVVGAIRTTLADARAAKRADIDSQQAAALAFARLEAADHSSLRPVFNLTGTILHTNLGRALIADAAVEAATAAMRNAVALEF